MAKRKKRRRSSGPKAKRCKMVKVDHSGKVDKIKLGSRYFKPCKGSKMDIHANGKTWVCPVGKKQMLSTSSGKLESLCKAPKR